MRVIRPAGTSWAAATPRTSPSTAPSTTVTVGDGPLRMTPRRTSAARDGDPGRRPDYHRNFADLHRRPVNAGTYYVTAHFAGDSNHYPSDGSPVAIIIQKTTSTTTVTGGTFAFNGNAHAATALVSGVGTGITQTAILTYSGSCSAAPITVAQGASCTATAKLCGRREPSAELRLSRRITILGEADDYDADVRAWSRLSQG